MQSCHAAAGLLGAWRGGVHWYQKHCGKWGSWSSMVSRGKTGKRKRGKLVAKKLFWLTVKWSVISSLLKLPVCGWAIVVSIVEKFVVLQLTTVKSLNLMHEWNKSLGAWSPKERQYPMRQFSHLQFHNTQTSNFDVQRQNPLWFLRWPHHFQFAAVAKLKTCTGILGNRTKFFPTPSSIWARHSFLLFLGHQLWQSRKGQNGKTKDLH